MKPLRILIGNNTLSLLAGSETWTRTLAIQLKAMGHHIACYSPSLGIIADELKEFDIKSYSNISSNKIKPYPFILEEEVDHTYDVIICNHHDITKYLRAQFPKTPIIATIHGIIHEFDGQIAPEHPALDAGVNQFVSVSEEVQKKLKDEYGLDSVIIRNFFDLKKFGSLKPANDKPKQFLVNTNYMGADDPAIKTIRETAKHFGARLAALGMNFSQNSDITKVLEDSDVVFGMGRSVLEGVAAGRLGIVHGRWGTGGPIVERYINDIRWCNFSGRNSEGIFSSTDELIFTIKEFYNPQNLEWGKNYTLKNHNVVLGAEEYIRLARELTGQVRPSSNGGVASDAKPFKLAK